MRYGRPTTVAGVAVLVLAMLIAIIVFASIANSRPAVNPSGPCMGGPVMGQAGQSMGNGNYRFSCVFGGSTIVHLGN